MRRLDEDATLLVTTIMPDCSDWIKSTNTSDFTFFKALLMLETYNKLFFMNLALLSPFIGMMTCFLDGPLVVI